VTAPDGRTVELDTMRLHCGHCEFLDEYCEFLDEDSLDCRKAAQCDLFDDDLRRDEGNDRWVRHAECLAAQTAVW